MSTFTLDDLRDLLRGGAEEGAVLDGDIANTRFDELGYDSLAVLEIAGEIQRRFGVVVPDDAVTEMPTPAKAVEFVNSLFARAGA
jgi:act minimal PKS acyl carrier protein